MASRRIMPTQKNEVDLGELIVNYDINKKQADKIKKVVDDYNKKIKQEMQKMGINEFIVGDIKATITITPKEVFNEDQAIEILRKTLSEESFKECVKTKEYIDDPALENLIYSGELDPAILEPCITRKDPTVTLRLGKVK